MQFEKTEKVHGFVDLDYIGDFNRSLIVYVFTIKGCVINWKATLQSMVELFIIEAKYMAITAACNETIWLKWLFGELSKDV